MNIALRAARQHNGAVTNLLDMCRDLPLATVPAGEVLLAQGAAPSRMFVLASGEVTVERDGVAVARVEAQDAGQYYFDCTVHPADMNGTLYVVEG